MRTNPAYLFLFLLWGVSSSCSDDRSSGMIDPNNIPTEPLPDMAGLQLEDLGIGVVPNPVDGGAGIDSLAVDVFPEDIGSLPEVTDDITTAEVIEDITTVDVAQPDTAEPDLTELDVTEEPIECTGPNPQFPSFSKTCTTKADCVVVFHVTDCCGTKAAWGIREDEQETFKAAETICVSQMPDCDCAPSPTKTDDGNTAQLAEDAYVTCDDGQCISHSSSPPPTTGAALQTWLEAGYYLTWPAENAPHASTGPHFGQVRVFQNDRLYNAAKTNAAPWPVGATSIKELFGNTTAPIGWSVSVKLQQTPPAGDGFYWYEIYQGQKYADGPSVPLCVNCHAAGTDYVLTKIP
ncbi:MAG: hypothetical protein HUU55_21645 [Myxococcales bacterium]|nr:hypothetical protein [Myxococcales bacterium]